MKRISIYIVLFLIASCSKAPKDTNIMNNDSSIKKYYEVDTEDFQYQNMSKQKLQDLFDLLVLQKEYPEFNQDITDQLNEIYDGEISISDKIKDIAIKSIKVIEPIKKLSDSLQSLKICFEVQSNLGITNDSLLVIIKTKKIVLDDQDLESKKLMFKKIN
ncbi:hypothetical protein JBL43_13695 [Aureibaculum sp. A20]|uniref:Lipoprotein n=1 Tax=Aureibaculum flavum TaxID=2795986 RepID=A0ABS0WTI9_9FLAO|nr:hypothetical protein [Aureibaculum flavum]MBJ2175302.1 hypothetical protein [Aureibaculum flavum]